MTTPLANDTIVALATPAAPAAIAVIRLSGPQAFDILAKAWRGARLDSIKSHTAHLGYITDTDGNDLDQALLTIFRAPNTFTGEDIAEISIHGSVWLQNRVTARLVQLGARPAAHGEFSQRAFLNGRLDLAQAEAVADLIAASSKAAQSLAMSQLKGDYSRKLNEIRSSLIEIASLLELELDFSEEDVEFADRHRLARLIDSSIAVVSSLAESFSLGNAFKNGVPTAIVGVPNAGKSSLLNTLIGYEKAIVTDIPGTTRDTIDETMEIDGVLFRFIDTAGLRLTDDPVERIGITRATDTLKKARIVLLLIDPTAPLKEQLDTLAPHLESISPSASIIPLLTKSDLHTPNNAVRPTDSNPHAVSEPSTADNPGSDFNSSTIGNLRKFLPTDSTILSPISISAKTSANIDHLKATLKSILIPDSNRSETTQLIITNQRHYDALKRTAEALTRARRTIDDALPPDLTAQDLRQATSALSEITGAITPDHLLHQIFSTFCIGK